MVNVSAADLETGRETARLHQINSHGRVLYSMIGLVSVAYMAAWVVFMRLYESDVYFFTYYAVDYGNGFVRRGLAGEILKLFPPGLYFTGQMTLRWLVPAIYVVGLGAIAYTVALRFGLTERRLMLAFLIPVLPFGFAGAVVLAMPTLLGVAAFAGFAVALVWVNNKRAVLFLSGGFGLVIATLCLVHEAIPLLVPLGAIMAVVVFVQHPIAIQRLSVALAVGPGFMVELVVALIGHRDVSSQCGKLPHKVMDWPTNVSQGAALGQKVAVDFHDFTCRNVIPLFDQNPGDAISSLVKLGAVPWIGSTLVGIAICATTFLAVSRISGVPFARFRDRLRERRSWVIVGIAVLIPLFATSHDWVRWWVTVSFDIGVVYLLYASGQPESLEPPNRRTRILFIAAISLFALLPIGTVSQIGTSPDLLT